MYVKLSVQDKILNGMRGVRLDNQKFFFRAPGPGTKHFLGFFSRSINYNTF